MQPPKKSDRLLDIKTTSRLLDVARQLADDVERHLPTTSGLGPPINALLVTPGAPTDQYQAWISGDLVGYLAKAGETYEFKYNENVSLSLAVSLTMPPRRKPYRWTGEIFPAFDVSVPEGYLHKYCFRRLSKTDAGRASRFDMAGITRKRSIGRVELLPYGYTPLLLEELPGSKLTADSFTSTDIKEAILEARTVTGVSGKQPKCLLTTQGCRHWIAKTESPDTPGICLIEFHCLQACRNGGTSTANAVISEDGKALLVSRFDIADGVQIAFEDFASLNGKTSQDKYEGSIESELFKTARAFAGNTVRQTLEDLYRQVVTSIALRNGDAHLKNYGLLYDDARDGPFTLTPAYDLVTTRAFDELKTDNMALTLGGTKRWPDQKAVTQLGARAQLTPARAREIMAEVAKGISEQIPVMLADMRGRGMQELGERLAAEWNDGLENSLGAIPVGLDVEDPFECGAPAEENDTTPGGRG